MREEPTTSERMEVHGCMLTHLHRSVYAMARPKPFSCFCMFLATGDIFKDPEEFVRLYKHLLQDGLSGSVSGSPAQSDSGQELGARICLPFALRITYHYGLLDLKGTINLPLIGS